MEKSHAARLEGNKLYKELDSENAGAQFRLIKARRAINLFTMAAQLSSNRLDERLSCIRSLAVVHLKAGTIVTSIATTLNAADIELAVYNLVRQCLTSLLLSTTAMSHPKIPAGWKESRTRSLRRLMPPWHSPFRP